MKIQSILFIIVITLGLQVPVNAQDSQDTLPVEIEPATEIQEAAPNNELIEKERDDFDNDKDVIEEAGANQSRKNQPYASNEVPIQYLRQFADVYTRIKQSYIEEVSDEELLENAIRGMMSSLDNYSVYFDESQYDDFRSDTQGRFGGIGVELIHQDSVLKIMSPIDDTPAQKAGILAGDSITHINGKAIRDYKENGSFDELKGSPGSQVTLTIAREGSDEPLEMTLTRAVIRIKTVKYETLEPQVGYVRIAQFQPDTSPMLRKALTNLLHENDGSLNGLIIDLRNNPGGTLGSAIEVSNLFLSEGTIVTVKDKNGEINGNYNAGNPDFFEGTNIVVLVNRGSASAAEIFSGAIKVNQRGTILGSTTYGKGSVQSVMPLNLGAGMKITTAKYYLGNGESINKTGVKPDVEFEEEPESMSLDIKDQPIIDEALALLKML